MAAGRARVEFGNPRSYTLNGGYLGMKLLFGSIVVLLICSLAPPAGAETVDDATRAAARDLGMTGVEAYEAGDYVAASEKLDKAYRTLRAASLGLWSARAFAKVGKLVEASERLLEVSRLDASSGDTAVQTQAQRDAAAERAALLARIPKLVIRIEGASASEVSVTLDGQPVPNTLLGERRPVNPGEHSLDARRGGESTQAEVTAAEGEEREVVLRFGGGKALAPTETPVISRETTPSGAPAAANGSARRTLAWVAVGAGGLGIAIGSVTGAMVLSKQGQIKDSGACRDYHCLSSMEDTVSSYNSLRTVSTVSFVAGGVFAAAGAVLLITTPSSRTSVTVGFSPGMATLSGRFQ